MLQHKTMVLSLPKIESVKETIAAKDDSQDINDNLCCTKIFVLPNDVKQRFMPHPTPFLPFYHYLVIFIKQHPQGHFLISACAIASAWDFGTFFLFFAFHQEIVSAFVLQPNLLAGSGFVDWGIPWQWKPCFFLRELCHVDIKVLMRMLKGNGNVPRLELCWQRWKRPGNEMILINNHSLKNPHVNIKSQF